MSALFEIADAAVDLVPQMPLLKRLRPRPALRINILRGIDLTIAPGEVLGLVGESGSGKSTLARVMVGLQPTSQGSLLFEGKPLSSKHDFSAFRRRAALMFQDPVASLSPRRKVEQLVVEPFIIHGHRPPDTRSCAIQLLDRVGLPATIAERYPHELSGGQARRVCVARALALNPSLVIADEPTAGLDVSVQAEILNLMTSLKSKLGLSYLIITHNLAMVRHVSDRIAILYLGRLVEVGPTRDVFAHAYHPYTRSLISSEPQPDPRKRRADLSLKGEVPSVLARPAGCPFHTRCAAVQPRCRSEEPPPRAIAPDRIIRCHFPITTIETHGGNQ